jgi:sRNA-binding protein
MSDANKPERNKRSWPSVFAGLPFEGPWPAVLPQNSLDPVLPLAIGLGDDLMLMLPEEHWPALRKALRVHCQSRRYLQEIACDGSMRHGIDGRPVSPVSGNDRLVAAAQLLAMAIRMTTAETRTRATPIADKLIATAPVRARGVTGQQHAITPHSASGTAKTPLHEAQGQPGRAAAPAAVLEAPSAPQPAIQRQGRGGRPIIKLHLSAKG